MVDNKTGHKVPGKWIISIHHFPGIAGHVIVAGDHNCLWKKLIKLLQKKQIGESVRDLGLAGEQQKKGTPTMGGIIIILAILIPTLLFANLNKVYIRLMLIVNGLAGYHWFY